jgi:hypothetical protein
MALICGTQHAIVSCLRPAGANLRYLDVRLARFGISIETWIAPDLEKFASRPALV